MIEPIEKIIEENNLPNNFTSVKPMDPENRIFGNDDYVIKIYYPKKFPYYYNELGVYQALSSKDYISNLISYKECQGYKYIIMSRLSGESMFSAFLDADLSQRKNYIKQISTILKDIRKTKTGIINFKEKFLNRSFALVNECPYSDELKKFLLDFYNTNAVYLKKLENGCFIHLDTHFYNFMVNHGNVLAYDFENMVMAPKDYQLTRWMRMWKYPNSVIYPKNTLTDSQVEKFDILMPELLKNDEDILVPNLTERVKMYSLTYLLEEAKRCHFTEEHVRDVINDNKTLKLERFYE